MPLSASLGGSDITEFCQKITKKGALNGIDSGIIRAPAHVVSGWPDAELVLSDGGTQFAGPVWYAQGEGDPNSAYVELTAFDHRIYLARRMCKTDTGNLITPGDVILDNVDAPSILAAFIANTDSFDASLPITLGTVDSGGADVTGVPTSFPMSVWRMAQLLVSTGQLDMMWSHGSGGGTLDLLDDYDNDLSGSVDYEYATGAHNCQIATVTVDMEEVINALWYLLGPRISEERWRGSITPTAPHPGGTWNAGLVTRFMDSRTAYGYMQEIQVFDDKGDENSIRLLFEERWANEAWIRAVPRTFASIRPERGIAPNFGVGDQIGVAAGSILNGGFSGSQTVYGYTWSTDFDGVDEIEEIITSADQQGATGAE